MKKRCACLISFFSATGALIVFGQNDSTPPVAPIPSVTIDAQVSAPPPATTSTVPIGVEAPIDIPHPVPQPITLRVVGSNVKNISGEYLGRIDSVIVNGENAKSEYAMILMNFPTNQTRYTPVPWGELSYVWDQSQVGGYPGALQLFLLNIDKATLEKAPTIDKSQWNLMRDAAFARQLAAFFGANDNAAIGTPGTATGVVTGTAAGGGVAAGTTTTAGVVTPGAITTASAVPAAAPGVPMFVGGGLVPFFLPEGAALAVETNVVGTSVTITTNVVLSNFVANGIQTNAIINLTNFPQFAATNGLFQGSGTNIVAGRPMLPGGSNVFAGGRPFVGSSNMVPGAAQPVVRNVGSTATLQSTRTVIVTNRMLTPTGRSIVVTQAIGPGVVGPQLPATPNTAPVNPPSTVAPPGVIAPQVPPPPAPPVLPTAPETAQPPSIPSTIAPPGTVVPQVPTTPPATR